VNLETEWKVIRITEAAQIIAAIIAAMGIAVGIVLIRMDTDPDIRWSKQGGGEDTSWFFDIGWLTIVLSFMFAWFSQTACMIVRSVAKWEKS
jgi:hypothetical protein